MKLKYKICYTLIVLILIFFSICTYAYYRKNINIKDLVSNITTDKNLTIKFNDTTNIALVSSNIGDKINKSFSITNNTNKTIYYDISFIDVQNNFSNLNNLKYTLTPLTEGAYVKNANAPTNDRFLASNIIIKPNDTHNYTLEIEFVKNEYDQSIDIDKTFSSKISVKSTKVEENSKSSIKNIIIKNTISSEINANDDGIYYTNNSIDGKTVYYYKGNTPNNNVVIGNMCFKIIRTTEDNGVRLIYNGEYINNMCDTSSMLNNINDYNSNSNSNAYVGYMYGNINSNNYDSEHSNINSSSIKIYLESWYNKNRDILEKYIKLDSIYCNNRITVKYTKDGISYTSLGYGNTNSAYLLKKEYYNNNVSYYCNKNDRFSTSSINGNGNLSDPVGLITVEELYYAGFTSNTNNKNNFLSLNKPYWTMTPAYYSANNAYNFVVNIDKLTEEKVTKEYIVRPVITIRSDLFILKGDGSINNPYIL